MPHHYISRLALLLSVAIDLCFQLVELFARQQDCFAESADLIPIWVHANRRRHSGRRASKVRENPDSERLVYLPVGKYSASKTSAHRIGTSLQPFQWN